jgi:hypothetical protein
MGESAFSQEYCTGNSKVSVRICGAKISGVKLPQNFPGILLHVKHKFHCLIHFT